MVKRKRRTKAEIEADKKKPVKKVAKADIVDVAETVEAVSSDVDKFAKAWIASLKTNNEVLNEVMDHEFFEENFEKGMIVYYWTTPSGGNAEVTLTVLNKVKERFQFTGSNEEFIKTIQKKIDNIACANPTWVMQRVFEELVK